MHNQKLNDAILLLKSDEISARPKWLVDIVRGPGIGGKAGREEIMS